MGLLRFLVTSASPLVARASPLGSQCIATSSYKLLLAFFFSGPEVHHTNLPKDVTLNPFHIGRFTAKPVSYRCLQVLFEKMAETPQTPR